MPPKKKAKQVPAETAPKETAPPVSKPAQGGKPIKPVQTKPVTVVQTKEVQKTQPVNKLVTTTSNQNSIIKLDEKDVEKKVIPLEGATKSQKQLRQLRAFKFGGKQTGISIDDASKLISQRARKFGGNTQYVSEQQKRKRAQKFGLTYVNKQQQKQLKKKRLQKFKTNTTSIPSEVISNQDKAIIQARRLKFAQGAQGPQPQKKQKLQE